MTSALDLALLNSLAATVLAVPVVLLSIWLRRPALLHGLWLVVLVKLLIPAGIGIPIPLPWMLAATPKRVQSPQAGESSAPLLVDAPQPAVVAFSTASIDAPAAIIDS